MQDWIKSCLSRYFSGRKIKRRRNIFKERNKLSLVKEEVRCFLQAIVIVILFSYFFYRSIIAVPFLSPLIYFYRKEKKKRWRKEKQEEAEVEFKDVLLSVKINLQAGYSIENAFIESRKDIIRIYGDTSIMAKELEGLILGMKNGIGLEKLLTDFGRKWKGEIEEFTSIFYLASGLGGRWNEIIKSTVEVITRKIEIKEEISILIHEKKTEHKIMCIIPFIIMLYMDITSDHYFKILYHNIFGIAVMTLAMAIYIYAYSLGEKITTIEE